MPTPKFKNIMTKNTEKKVTVTGSESESNVASLIEKLEAPVSKIPFNFKVIPREKLEFHSHNSYPQEDIEKLANGILNMGLIHNLEAVYDEENDIYVIESGERRTRAIDFLLSKFQGYENKDDPEYKKFLENVSGFISGFPVNVKRSKFNESDLLPIDEIDSQIRLIDANEEVRAVDPQNRAFNIAKRAKLLEKKNQLLREQGRNSEVVNINKAIADSQGITERQVQTYKRLTDLIPELLEEFKSKNITLTDGSNYARLSAEEQKEILALIKSGEKVSAQDIKILEEEKALQYAEIEAKEKDLAQKQIEIQSLKALQEHEKEKNDSEVKKIKEAAEKELTLLKSQIEEERQKKTPNDEKISDLEQQIKASNESSQQQLAAANKAMAAKEGELKKLQKELKALKSAKPAKEDMEALRLEIKIATMLDQIERDISSLQNSIKLCSDNQDKYKNQIMKLYQYIGAIYQL